MNLWDFWRRRQKSHEGFTCGTCGEWHKGLPLGYYISFPEAYFDVPEGEREARIGPYDEEMVIDDNRFFLKANIEIPIQQQDDKFGWTVWVEMTEKDSKRVSEIWDVPNRASEPPIPIWIACRIGLYMDTLGLKGKLIHTPPNVRRLLVLDDGDHPLVKEQRSGIGMARVREIASLALHSPDSVTR